jgi:N-acylneuraminate cytidylyltransferase
MWVVDENRMKPLLPDGPADPPWHSMAYQSLPPVYIQNASLEIAWTQVPLEGGSIAGTVVSPFFTEGYEGLDLNDDRDWWYAEHLVDTGQASLPAVSRAPYGAGASHAPTSR